MAVIGSKVHFLELEMGEHYSLDCQQHDKVYDKGRQTRFNDFSPTPAALDTPVFTVTLAVPENREIPLWIRCAQALWRAA